MTFLQLLPGNCGFRLNHDAILECDTAVAQIATYQTLQLHIAVLTVRCLVQTANASIAVLKTTRIERNHNGRQYETHKIQARRDG